VRFENESLKLSSKIPVVKRIDDRKAKNPQQKVYLRGIRIFVLLFKEQNAKVSTKSQAIVFCRNTKPASEGKYYDLDVAKLEKGNIMSFSYMIV
jgi:hypothetical protein